MDENFSFQRINRCIQRKCGGLEGPSLRTVFKESRWQNFYRNTKKKYLVLLSSSSHKEMLDICLKGDLHLNLANIKPDIQALAEIQFSTSRLNLEKNSEIKSLNVNIHKSIIVPFHKGNNPKTKNVSYTSTPSNNQTPSPVQVSHSLLPDCQKKKEKKMNR